MCCVYPRLSMRLTELVTPLKPLEAMAQGRLLVASDVGGHRELIRDGETGVLFKAGDAEALAAKVLALLADRARWPRMRVAARRFVETERNWAASVAPLPQVYRSVSPATPMTHMSQPEPAMVVFTTLFPHAGQPGAGLFIRERMFRVAKVLPLTVVAPVSVVSVPGASAQLEAGIPSRGARERDPGRHRGAAPALLFGARRIQVARRLLHGAGLPADHAAPQALVRVQRDRCPFRVSGRVRGDAAGPLAARPGDDHAARHRGAAVARPGAGGGGSSRRCNVRGVSSRCPTRSSGTRSASVRRGDRIMVVGNGVDTGKFHRVARQAAREQLGAARGCAGAGVGRRAGRAQGLSPRDRMPARACGGAFPACAIWWSAGPGPEGDWRALLHRARPSSGCRTA